MCGNYLEIILFPSSFQGIPKSWKIMWCVHIFVENKPSANLS